MSKVIASLIVAALGTVGLTIGDSTAVELAGLILNVAGLLGAYISRVRMGGVNVLGIRQS